MGNGTRAVAITAMVAAATLAIRADVTSRSESGEVQLQLGNEFMNEGRYEDALEAYRLSLRASMPADPRQAHSGVIQSALRLAEFDVAKEEGEALVKVAPRDPESIALYADALWAAGMFQESEAAYAKALALEPELARGHHGTARSLAARGRETEALDEVQTAIRLAPRDLEAHHTLGSIYKALHRYEEAAAAFSNYINLLPNKDHSEKAEWSRAEVKFLHSFGQHVAMEVDPGADDQVYTVDFRLVNGKIMVRARVNDGPLQDFGVDTGSENTVITNVTARRAGISPITYTLSAGVGDYGLRGLPLSRINVLEIGSLRIRNVPCIIKDPPLRELPSKEIESLSPISFGYSMTIDYGARKITFGKHLPEEPADVQLPMRMYRLATVVGTVDGTHRANFVIDTGGEVISISRATASALDRPAPTHRINLRVFGASGWEKDAFLLPGVDLAFDDIRYTNFPVVVLNLNTPSALLGFQLGGIVGHRFLKNYRVAIDLEHSVLRLKRI